jgi:hypothetical protein
VNATGLAIPAAVAVALALLRRVAPRREDACSEGPPLTEDERVSLRTWYLASVALWLYLAAALGLAWYGAFRFLGPFVLRPGADTLFLLGPDPEAMAIPAIFLGIVSPLKPVELVLRALLRARYKRFELYRAEKEKLDDARVSAGLYWFVAAFTVAFFVWWPGRVARIGANGIDLEGGVLPSAEPIPYERVRAVQVRRSFEAPSGNRVRRTHHAIVFDDGTEWTTKDSLRRPRGSDLEAMQYVAQRSGRAIEAEE